jgi:hypothetical protein
MAGKKPVSALENSKLLGISILYTGFGGPVGSGNSGLKMRTAADWQFRFNVSIYHPICTH